MSKTKKDYYDEAYTIENIRKSPIPTLTYLSRRLQRFDSPAHQVVLNLLTGGEKLLDIGCGDGSFASLAETKFKEIFAIDISPHAIRKAQAKMRNKDNSHFLIHDADQGLPYNQSFFDAVTCIALLEHMTHPPNLLREIKRILKKNGELVILVPNDAWIVYRLQFLTGRIPQSGFVDELGVDWGHLHKFNKRIITDLLRSRGYLVRETCCSGIFAGFRKTWLPLLASDIIVKAIAVK
jgi:2-polyprenyl-3-methyl-5-hydroxy-6-metoxy-1,4-benzoquinol methylase